jgi:hypothetical protein
VNRPEWCGPGPDGPCRVWDRLAACAVSLCLLAPVSGCRAPHVAAAAPPVVTVDLGRLEALHPAAADLALLRRRASGLPVADGAPIPGVAPPPTAPSPAPQTAAPARAPRRAVDATRAAAEIRADYARRREAAPLPDAPVTATPATPAPPVPAAPAAPAPAAEFTTGLEGDISRLQRQLDQLRETPQDRLLYAPVQLRRRRELFEVTRAELERLRREHLARLEAALSAGGPRRTERPPRPPRTPAAPPRAVPTRFPELDAAEQRALAAIPREPTLPPPLPTADPPPAEDPHRADRERFLNRVRAAGGPRGSDAQRLLEAWRRRAEALQAAIRDDLRRAAATAAAEAGLRLVFDTPARDATRRLEPRIRALLTPAKGPTR